jgi:hypothetical protein
MENSSATLCWIGLLTLRIEIAGKHVYAKRSVAVKHILAAVTMAVCTIMLTANSMAAASASSLDNECKKVRSAAVKNGKWKKGNKEETEATFDSGQCSGYIQGWLEATDGSIIQGGTNGKLYLVRIDTEHVDTWKVAEALHNHLAASPLDGDKRADAVLLRLMIDNKLVETTEVLSQTNVTSDQQ